METQEKPRWDPLPEELLWACSKWLKSKENRLQKLENMLEFCDKTEVISDYVNEFKHQELLSLIWWSNKLEDSLPEYIGGLAMHSLLERVPSDKAPQDFIWKLLRSPNVSRAESQFDQHFKALNYLYSIESLTEPLTSDKVKTTYKILVAKYHFDKEDLESYRQSKVVITDGYIYPEPSSIADEMAKIVKRFNDSSDHYILRAAKLFFELVNLHPFAMGNTRLCHMMLAYALMKGGNCSYPVCIIPIDERDNSYQDALWQVRRFNDYSLLVYLIIHACYSAKKNYESNAKISQGS